MNEILATILMFTLLIAAIVTGIFGYEDNPTNPKWVTVSCAWACPLLVLLMLILFF